MILCPDRQVKKLVWGLELYLKDILTQVFSCVFWDIFKKTSFTEHFRD